MAKTDKLTPKQEAFALKYVECGNASEAYRHAYDAENSKPETIWKRACELLSDRKVTGRVSELKAGHAKRHEVTIDSLTETLEKAIKLAEQIEQPNAMVSAVKEMGTLHGVRVEKSTQTVIQHETALDLIEDDSAVIDARDPRTH